MSQPSPDGPNITFPFDAELYNDPMSSWHDLCSFIAPGTCPVCKNFGAGGTAVLDA